MSLYHTGEALAWKQRIVKENRCLEKAKRLETFLPGVRPDTAASYASSRYSAGASSATSSVLAGRVEDLEKMLLDERRARETLENELAQLRTILTTTGSPLPPRTGSTAARSAAGPRTAKPPASAAKPP